MPDFYRKWFDRTLQHAVSTVNNSSLGNYTTAYNSWKRLESIKSLLQEKISRLFKGPDKSSDINIIAEENQGQNNDHIHDDHISTRGVSAWKQTFISSGFSVKSMKRHSILYGGDKYNRHRILFAFIMFLDSILDRFPFGYSLSEGVTYKLIKA